MKLRSRYTDTLITKLDGLVDTEHTIAKCFDHLASLIKNGQVKTKFCSYSATAKKNEVLFLDSLKKLGVSNAVFEDRCSLCKINPASFSLSGALNLGIEVMDIARKYYDDLIVLCESDADKKMFKEMLKAKIKQRDQLKKERRFEHKEDESSAATGPYGISQVVSKLYK